MLFWSSIRIVSGISSHEELCEVEQADDNQIADSLSLPLPVYASFCYKKLKMNISSLEHYHEAFRECESVPVFR